MFPNNQGQTTVKLKVKIIRSRSCQSKLFSFCMFRKLLNFVDQFTRLYVLSDKVVEVMLKKLLSYVLC